MLSNTLKDRDTRNTVRELKYEQGMSGRAIGRLLDIPETSIREYLNGDTYSGEGKLQYDPEDVKLSVKGDAVTEACVERKPLNLPPRTKDNSEFYDTCLQTIKNCRDEGYKIVVIADTQCKPDEDLSYMSWIGRFVNSNKPDVVVHIGDHFDVPSLSSYDKGKKTFEGRRLKADIEAGTKGLELFHAELDAGYHPRLVFCLGNHEHRIDRLANDVPELDGFVGVDLLPMKDMGWEVHDFLKPVEIGGIFFVHYLANPFSGKPYGGSALNQLKTVGNSFVVGHKQCLDVYIRPTLNGKHQIGIINGACLTPDHKVLTSDLRYIPLGDVKVGQELVSFDETTQEKSHRRFKTGKVLAHKIEKDIVYEVKLSSGKAFKVTNDHKWLVKTGTQYFWKETNQLVKGTRVVKALDEWETLTDYDSGWLSGIYDGEGSYTARKSGNSTCCQLAVYQNEGAVLDKIKTLMFNNLGMEANTSVSKRRSCFEVKTKGGISSIVKLLGAIRPIRLLGKFKPEDLGRLSTTSSENPSVESITLLGEQDIVRIHVDVGTMIVEGFAHHNCYPFDEGYKGHQGNNHFRGVTVLHEVKDGFGTPMFVSLDRMMKGFINCE